MYICNADGLFFRPRGPIWRAIAVAGRSEYTHVAMASYCGDGRIRILQETSGERHTLLLSSVVKKWPGVIDVYETNAIGDPNFSRAAAVDAMREIIKADYGWGNLFLAGLYHVPFVRFVLRPNTDDYEGDAEPKYLRRPFCSQAVAMACRAGGCDPVPNLPDRLTEPGDLARSVFFKYRFTLV